MFPGKGANGRWLGEKKPEAAEREQYMPFLPLLPQMANLRKDPLLFAILSVFYTLLQGIFPTLGLNPGLPHCRQILYQLCPQGSPRILEWVAYPFSRGSSPPRNRTRVSRIAGRFFTSWVTREARLFSKIYYFMRKDSTNQLSTSLLIWIWKRKYSLSTSIFPSEFSYRPQQVSRHSSHPRPEEGAEILGERKNRGSPELSMEENISSWSRMSAKSRNRRPRFSFSIRAEHVMLFNERHNDPLLKKSLI